MDMFQDGNFYMGGMHGAWWVFWVLIIGVLVFYSSMRSRGQQRHPGELPHAVLRRRLASGEIAEEEFKRCKALLDRDADGKR